MSLEPVIDPATGQYTDDYLIAKAFEALRMRFRERLPQSFYGRNFERARLILKVEGRTSDAIVQSLLPFAEAQASPKQDWQADAHKAIVERKVGGAMTRDDAMVLRGLHDFWKGMMELGRVQWVNRDREVAEAVMAEAREALGRMEGRGDERSGIDGA